MGRSRSDEPLLVTQATWGAGGQEGGGRWRQVEGGGERQNQQRRRHWASHTCRESEQGYAQASGTEQWQPLPPTTTTIV